MLSTHCGPMKRRAPYDRAINGERPTSARVPDVVGRRSSRRVSYRCRGFGEVEPAGIEAFAGGVVVVLAGWWARCGSCGRVGDAGFGDVSPVTVVELEITEDVGVAA